METQLYQQSKSDLSPDEVAHRGDLLFPLTNELNKLEHTPSHSSQSPADDLFRQVSGSISQGVANIVKVDC